MNNHSSFDECKQFLYLFAYIFFFRFYFRPKCALSGSDAGADSLLRIAECK